jgi:transcriptional regulator with XRE-family HTH domain
MTADALALEIGARLRLLRRRADMKAQTLAKRLGVTRHTVWNWERGRSSPDAYHLVLLARALGVTPGSILDQVYAVLKFEGGKTDG